MGKRSFFRRPLSADNSIYLQVGLDWGTSSTKIAYGPRAGMRRFIKPLLFDIDTPLVGFNEYCYPSVAAIQDDGIWLFGYKAVSYLKHRPYSEGIKYLKTVLGCMDNARNQNEPLVNRYKEYMKSRKGYSHLAEKPDLVAAIFLCHMLTVVREKLSEEYPGQKLDIAFNVCVPIDQLESSMLYERYKKIMGVVNLIGMEWTERYSSNELVDIVCDLFDACNYDEEDEETRTFLIPEPMAQATSYLTSSLQVNRGHHAIVDIGAGTTDVSIFGLPFPRGYGSRIDWYAAATIPKGTEYILRPLFEIYQANEKLISNEQEQEIMLSTNLQEEEKRLIMEQLTDVWKDSRQAWKFAYGKYKTQSAWRGDMVRVFLLGGGSSLHGTSEIFSESWMKDWGPYQVSTIPVPSNYEEYDAIAPFSRMAVAYGLAIPKAEMPKHRLPKDCPDKTPERKPVRTPLDHEDLYSD